MSIIDLMLILFHVFCVASQSFSKTRNRSPRYQPVLLQQLVDEKPSMRENSRLRYGAYALPAVASLAEVKEWESVGITVITIGSLISRPTGTTLLMWSLDTIRCTTIVTPRPSCSLPSWLVTRYCLQIDPVTAWENKNLIINISSNTR